MQERWKEIPSLFNRALSRFILECVEVAMTSWLRLFGVAVALGIAGIVFSLGVIGTAQAQGPFNPISALVVNTESKPVPVAVTGSVDVASAAEYFQANLGGGDSSYTVPAGKRAVIKFATGKCLYNPTSTQESVTIEAGGVFVELASSNPSKIVTLLGNQTKVFDFTHQVLIRTEPGRMIRWDPPTGGGCFGFISGDLIPAE